MPKHDRSRSRSRSASSSSSRTSSSSSSRSRSRKHNSSSKHSKKRSHRSRDRSNSRDRKKSKKSKKEKKHSRKSSRSRSKKRTKREHSSRSRSRDIKHESSSSTAAASSSSSLSRIKDEERARSKASESTAEREARRAARKALKALQSSTSSSTAAPSLVDGVSLPASTDKLFVWKKKIEKDITQGVQHAILSRAELAAKQAAREEEIAQVKIRKIARAEEKEQMDRMREELTRQADAEQVEGWEEKEEEFHRQNAAASTNIRIAEGREKLIDILAKNRILRKTLFLGLSPDERAEVPHFLGAELDPNLSASRDIELTPPHVLLSDPNLIYRDLELFIADVEKIRGLERADDEYWQACIAVARENITKQKSSSGYGAVAASSSAAAAALKADMSLLLRGKTVDELESLSRDIKSLLAGHRPASLAHLEEMDEGWWLGLKTELDLAKHVAYLREQHIELLKMRREDLQVFVRNDEIKRREKREAERQAKIERGEITAAEAAADGGDSTTAPMADVEEEDFEPKLIPHDQYAGTVVDDVAMEKAGAAADDEEDGSFSPVLIPVDADDELDRHASTARAIAAIDPEQDARELAEQRRLVAEQKQRELEERAKLGTGSEVLVSTLPSSSSTAAAASSSSSFLSSISSSSSAMPFDSSDAAYRRESSRALEGDEVQLRSEFVMPSETYWWGDKYRPRKPRFFNRVKTGYEWNKYNCTHYDKENPPPKIVQGYKFNIFYPDLINPNEAPKFRFEPDPEGNPDFVILRFMAGPPYEDLAFKIVKKEWEYSFKRGYKCVFEKGVLALYFNFRRYFYRR